MGPYLIMITGLIYLGCAVDFAIKQSVAMAVVYFGYALANVGLYYMAKAI